MRLGYLMGALGVASVVLMGSARAADKWFVLAEPTIKATDPSVKITAEDGQLDQGGRQETKLSVEGADVEISKVVLHWNNRPDETIWDVGIVKAGGETAAKDAPDTRGPSTVTIKYKILGGKPTAIMTLWGYD